MRAAFISLLLVATPLAAALAAGTAGKTPPPQGPPPPVAAPCANPDAIGLSRTVEIDTTGGPGFGLEQYKAYDFLEPKEVVLTFDDGPQVNTTKAILETLDAQCTKATFFSIGKMALGLPELIREVARRGHTIASHTWSHADLSKKDDKEAIEEIERGLSAVTRGLGVPIAPFFRFPYLKDSPATLTHLASRNIATFSMDVDSFDFKFHNPEQLLKVVMGKLEKKGKGIVLMHDIQPGTAKALSPLLAELKAKGYKIVHVKPKEMAKTLAEYDALVEKDVKGLPVAGTERPVTSVVRTVPNSP
ncbi:MAG TPA: polysaccharide deacetylase family protein [Hyphomicrobiaceae bacterium]|nr:polysaccharide deacetylase family protein [Hyphomicrobiaceae bacterium]